MMLRSSIFVVEDEGAFYDIYKAVFSLIEVELVGWAYSGEEAVVMFKELKACPDLVVMDYRLPGMNGIETTTALAQINPEVRTLFVSADGSIEEQAIRGGAVGFLQKPFELSAFIAAIGSAIPGLQVHLDPEKARIRRLKPVQKEARSC
ncbi:MAG: response regulator [Thermoplasmata archaeon]|nr:response regulator [Thermoplasmata archaeon]